MAETTEHHAPPSLTTRGITGSYFFLIFLSALGVGISLYLTNRYMEVNFPQGLVGASACDINSFFNCDSSTLSPISNIFGIPISVLGFLFFINIIASCIFPSNSWERANHTLAWVNTTGCLALLLYSLIFLSSLCPFCAGYWIISLGTSLLFWKKGLPMALPDRKVLLIYLGLSGIVLGGYTFNIADKKQSRDTLAFALMDQFRRKPMVEEPVSPNKIYLSTEKFEDAPLRISKFSDFQCPSCKTFADIIPKLTQKYRGKINIQYLFYPLDQNCNDKIKRPFHPVACQAAFLAHCSGEKFVSVHDEIFEKQRGLTQSWIDKKAQELGVVECQKSPETLAFVKSQIALGNKLGVESTPTLVINGKKIPGSLSLQQFYLLFDQILKRK